jgi:hypothetical protein
VLTGRSNSTVRLQDGGTKIPRQFQTDFALLNGRGHVVSYQVTKQPPKKILCDNFYKHSSAVPRGFRPERNQQ